MRPPTKFLTAVWGPEYIERFATFALPSFLAPGNLPALATATDLEVLVLTAKRDFRAFDKYPAVQRLRALCPVRFVDIGDLIVGQLYGVTLTLAYARAVMGCGSGMVGTYFVFMNADFVLADGSLRTLSKQILAGRSIVLAPSLRASEEALDDHLRARICKVSSTLVISPREMTTMALAHPHPTVVAKTVNQPHRHIVSPNQFLWRVGPRTLLARYYLSFMLCLKPERPLAPVNTFCDYGFIPEMCPSADEVMLGDSDEFFILELQARQQEAFLLRHGPMSVTECVRGLSEWSTAEHRRTARYDIVFNAGDVTPDILETAKVEAASFIDALDRRLGPPVPHAFHHYWVAAMGLFQNLRLARGLPALPPEMSSLPGLLVLPRRTMLRVLVVWTTTLVATLHRRLFGAVPYVTILHPDWLDFHHLQQSLVQLAKNAAGRVLLVREKTPLEGELGVEGYPVTLISPPDAARTDHDSAAPPITDVFIYLKNHDPKYIARVLDQVKMGSPQVNHYRLFIRAGSPDVADEGLLSDAFEANTPVDDASRYGTFDAQRLLAELKLPAPQTTVQSVVANPLKNACRRSLARLRHHYLRFGIAALIWVIPAAVMILPVVLLGNVWGRSKVGRLQPGNCSSMLIATSRLPA